MLLLSVIKDIEIIGEAAVQLSEEFRSCHPNIPWAMIKGMRNRLIHAYWEVNAGIIWSTVTEDIPELMRFLDVLLAEN